MSITQEKKNLEDLSENTLQQVPSTTVGEVREKQGFLASLRYYENWLDHKFGFEHHAVERITPDKKQNPSLWALFFIWSSSGVYGLTAFSIGLLPWDYGLSLTEAIAVQMAGMLLGCVVVGYIATLGPATGLRGVALSRFSFGWWPSKIIALFNLFLLVGFSAVQCIVAGQGLTAVSDYSLTLAVGIVICAVIGFVTSLGGYKALVIFETYMWIPLFILTLIVYGETGHLGNLSLPPSVTGISYAGPVLTYFAASYGCTCVYASWVADYCVHYQANTSRVKLFACVVGGMWVTTFFGMFIGCATGSALSSRPELVDMYTEKGVGALLLAVTYPSGFAKFILVVFSFGGVGYVTCAIYSASLAVQQLARPLEAIPRFIWSIIWLGVILLLSLVGQNQLMTFLNNILVLIGYYGTLYFVIICTEHVYFRKGKFTNYDLDGWDTASRLPIGLAALAAFVLGWVGAVMGMDTSFYIGPIARHIGNGDVANYMASAISLIAYVPLRHLELKYLRR